MLFCSRTVNGCLTCQLPLLGRHFASSLDHWHRPKVTVGDPHEEGEEARPGGVGQRGRAGWVHAHDKQRDEDHPEAGEEEQAASGPVVRQRCQDLRTEVGGQQGCQNIWSNQYKSDFLK